MNERVELTRWITLQLVWTLLQGFAVAFAVKFVIAAFGTAVSLTSAWAVGIVAVGALRLQRLALPRRPRRNRSGRTLSWLEGNADEIAGAEASAARLLGGSRPGGRAQPAIHWDAPLPETLEHRFARMYRHVDRVTYAVAETRHYDAGVRPVLAEIARDRLRRYHGVDLDADPARSRALMGDDLWNAVTATPPRTPTLVDLDRWLDRLERLAADPLGPTSGTATSVLG